MFSCLFVLAWSVLCMQWSHHFCVKDETLRVEDQLQKRSFIKQSLVVYLLYTMPFQNMDCLQVAERGLRNYQENWGPWPGIAVRPTGRDYSWW